MGNKIPLSEPESGDSLDASKVNSDIGNWQTASAKVGKDGDNFRDQGLDLCNFEAGCVRTERDYISLGAGVVINNDIPLSSIPFRISMTSVDLSQGQYVLRYSLRYRSLMNHGSDGTQNSGNEQYYDFFVYYLYEYEGTTRGGILPFSRRRTGMRNVTLKSLFLDGSITFACLFDKNFLLQESANVPANAVLDQLQIIVRPTEYRTSGLGRGDIRIHGFTMQLENFKR
tara:strand:+ start:474 stop:1157 length:684 start_codon:yes stop_codon:yes gene_type:complete